MPSLLISLALSIWGWTASIPFTWTSTSNTDSTSWIERRSNDPICHIFTGARWGELGFLEQVAVATHEVGHCLGLDHVAQQSLMAGDAALTMERPTAADFADLERLHPGQVRRRSLFVAMVASD